MALTTSDCDAMRSPSIKWPYSPRIVMRCAHRASHGPDHLGLCCQENAKLEANMLVSAEPTDCCRPCSVLCPLLLLCALSRALHLCCLPPSLLRRDTAVASLLTAYQAWIFH